MRSAILDLTYVKYGLELFEQTECGVALLTDPERWRHYRTCFENWNYDCFIHFKQGCSKRLLAELDGLTLRGLSHFLWQFIENGGRPDEVKETRDEYLYYEFHYDFRIVLPGSRRLTYIETIMEMTSSDPQDSMVIIVSVHDA